MYFRGSHNGGITKGAISAYNPKCLLENSQPYSGGRWFRPV